MIRNQYNQVPHLTPDTNGKVTNSQLDTTNESQEVSPFPVDDHKAHITRSAQRHTKHKTEKNMKDQQYIKLNTGAKEIQQVNPGEPGNSQSTNHLIKLNTVAKRSTGKPWRAWQQQKHQAPTISSINKSLS